MNKKMSLRDMWKFCVFQAEGYPIIKYILILGAVTGASVAYINSFLSARILDCLLGEQYAAAERYVYLMVIIVLIVELTAKACKRMFHHYLEPSEDQTKKRTAQKAFSMEYEEMEKSETLQSFRRVRQGEIGHGGIVYQLETIYDYFTQVVKILFAVIFVVVLLSKSDFRKERIVIFLFSTVLLVSLFVGVLILGKKVSVALGRMSLDMNTQNEKTNSEGVYIGELLYSESCGQDIRIYQLCDYMMKKFDVVKKTIQVLQEGGSFYGKKNGMMAFALQFLAGMTYCYIALKANVGSVSIGEVIMYAGAIITMMDSIRQLMSRRIEIDYSNEYLKTYEAFIQKPNMHYDGTLPVEKRIDNHYALELQHVSFRYPGSKEDILHDVNLQFHIGEKLALVGRNGAGKTTLIKLLLRLYEPTEGKILLNGIDIGKYDYEEYTRIFSVVFQDYRLYHLPLDENIAASEQVDERRVRAVLKQVGLEERVERMKEGIHTTLYHETGDGEALSGGEAQKVAIARALYKDAPFVVLDEPTAALDPIAEAEIYENFNGLVGDKTSIYISHRMSSCKFCQRIVVLDHGKIAEEGTHDELMGLDGIYAKLYQTQAQYYNE